MIENIVGKEEKAGNEHLTLATRFSKVFSLGIIILVDYFVKDYVICLSNENSTCSEFFFFLCYLKERSFLKYCAMQKKSNYCHGPVLVCISSI